MTETGPRSEVTPRPAPVARPAAPDVAAARPELAAEPEPAITPRALGVAGVRTALTALAVGTSLTAYVKLGWPGEHVATLVGFFGPIHLIERAAARRAASLRRDLVLVAGVWLLATLGVASALLELGFLQEVLGRGRALSLEAAGRILSDALQTLGRRGNAFALLALAAPAVPTALARVRGLDRGAFAPLRLALLAGANVALAVPPLSRSGLTDARFWPVVLFPAVLLPLVGRLTDGIEARWLAPPPGLGP